jgi:hypothetical protein
MCTRYFVQAGALVDVIHTWVLCMHARAIRCYTRPGVTYTLMFVCDERADEQSELHLQQWRCQIYEHAEVEKQICF